MIQEIKEAIDKAIKPDASKRKYCSDCRFYLDHGKNELGQPHGGCRKFPPRPTGGRVRVIAEYPIVVEKNPACGYWEKGSQDW